MNKLEYITETLAEETDKQSIKNAYDRCDISIVKVGSVYWFERCDNNKLYKTIQKEMKRLFPDLVFLHDI